MNETLIDGFAVEEPGPEFKPRLDLLLLYEDATTTETVLQLCRRFFQKLGSDYLLQPHGLTFDALRNLRTRQRAASEAAEADMVIVSVHADRELPFELKSCLELWVD